LNNYPYLTNYPLTKMQNQAEEPFMRQSTEHESSIEVMLVDDHQIIRDGIKQFLNEEANINVIAEASNVEDAIRQLAYIQPDVVITDLSMPGSNGLSLLKIIQEEYPEINTIVLSQHLEEAYIKRAIEVGVSGYLPKNISKYVLVEAIQKTNEGEAYFSEKISQILMGTMIRKVRKNQAKEDEKPAKLSPREKEVVKLIMEGMNSPQIAEKLFISHRTVESHRANIMQKLKVKNIIELVRFVLENDYLKEGIV